MKETLLIVALISLVSACEPSADLSKVKDLQHHYLEYKKAAHLAASSDYDYFRMEQVDRNVLTDTIIHCNERIFTDKALVDALNKDVTAWLRDWVFIGESKTMKGTFVIDTTDLMGLEDAESYFKTEDIKKSQPVEGKLFHLRNSTFKAHVGGNEVKYRIVPANPEIIGSIGEYKIETTGDYIPIDMPGVKRPKMYQMWYSCFRVRVDWYITIRSDDFLDKPLAVKLSDVTYQYINAFP